MGCPQPYRFVAAVRICNANGGVTPRRGSPNESAMNRQIIRSGFTPSMPASIST